MHALNPGAPITCSADDGRARHLECQLDDLQGLAHDVGVRLGLQENRQDLEARLGLLQVALGKRPIGLPTPARRQVGMELATKKRDNITLYPRFNDVPNE